MRGITVLSLYETSRRTVLLNRSLYVRDGPFHSLFCIINFYSSSVVYAYYLLEFCIRVICIVHSLVSGDLLYFYIMSHYKRVL